MPGQMETCLKIDDMDWSVAYREQPPRSRADLQSIRAGSESSRQRYTRESRHGSGFKRTKASLSNGIHRRGSKRSRSLLPSKLT